MLQDSVRLENIRCILCMIVAMAGFAVEDAIIKQLSISLPISQILILIGSGGLITFFLAGAFQKISLFNPDTRKPWFIVRSFCELAAAISFVSAVVYGSLSISSAIIQATPLAIVAGGALFLQQRVSGPRWMLLLICFLGVLLVTQPGQEGFKPATLFAFAAVIFLAVRDTITRLHSVSIPSITLSFWAFFASLLAGIATIPFFPPFQTPSPHNILLVATSIITGSVAYYCIVLATRAGEISVVAPFRYTRLLFALILSVIFFNEPVNELMLLGSALIIVSGVMMLVIKD